MPPQTRTIDAVLNRDFLEIRAKILEVAASLDRLDRAAEPSHPASDRRMASLRAALEALIVPEPGRAETVQRIFSLEYDAKWREGFGLGEGRARE